MKDHIKYLIYAVVYTVLGVAGLTIQAQSTLPKEVEAVLEDKNKLMSLEFVDADLRHVLRLLAKQNNLNIITNEDIEGTVTVSFDQVTLRGALESILTSNGYDYVMHENIIIVKESTRDMPGDTETRVYKLKFIDASDAMSALQNVVSDERGFMEVFQRNYPDATGQSNQQTGGVGSNVLVVTDDPRNFSHIDKVIEELDQPVPQIMIAVKFIETRLEADNAMGINWAVKARLTGGPSVSSGLTGGTGAVGGVGGSQNQEVGFPLFGQINNLDLATLSFREFQAVLEMLHTRGNSKLLSDPRITTLDNQPASIEVGTTVPVLVPQAQQQGGAFGGSSIPQVNFEEIDVSINLNVVPHVNTDRYITMVVEPSVEAISGFTGPDQDRPIVSSRTARTQVMVRDGETIAIGGLIKEDKFETKKKVPILGDLPLIGFLFRHSSEASEKTDLLIFITPHIVGPNMEQDQLSIKEQ